MNSSLLSTDFSQYEYGIQLYSIRLDKTIALKLNPPAPTTFIAIESTIKMWTKCRLIKRRTLSICFPQQYCISENENGGIGGRLVPLSGFKDQTKRDVNET